MGHSEWLTNTVAAGGLACARMNSDAPRAFLLRGIAGIAVRAVSEVVHAGRRPVQLDAAARIHAHVHAMHT